MNKGEQYKSETNYFLQHCTHIDLKEMELNCQIYFFIRTILQEHEAHFCSKFKNKLRTIPASEEEQSLKF